MVLVEDAMKYLSSEYNDLIIENRKAFYYCTLLSSGKVASIRVYYENGNVKEIHTVNIDLHEFLEKYGICTNYEDYNSV